MSGRRLVEDCLILDLAWLMRLGPIRDGMVGIGQIQWSLDGAPTGTADFRLDMRNRENASLILRFSAGRIETTQSVALTALPQHFGGLRWWMLCPATGERVRILHLPPDGDRFASRKAWGLAYRVEQLNRFDRPFEKLFRAQRRLGSVQGLGAELQKPKGMWRRTFARHADHFDALDTCCAEKIAALIERA